MSLYKCYKTVLLPPENFIPYNLCEGFKSHIPIDKCLEEEILTLWQKGIKTTGCCCGHGKVLGYIGVTEDCIERMEELGYQQYIFPDEFGGIERKDTFIPKTTYHQYDGYSDGFLG